MELSASAYSLLWLTLLWPTQWSYCHTDLLLFTRERIPLVCQETFARLLHEMAWGLNPFLTITEVLDLLGLPVNLRHVACASSGPASAQCNVCTAFLLGKASSDSKWSVNHLEKDTGVVSDFHKHSPLVLGFRSYGWSLLRAPIFSPLNKHLCSYFRW